MKLSILVFPMHKSDIEAVASIHSERFPNQEDSFGWIRCNFNAYPRAMLFVARDEQDNVIGYIQWLHKSGFRKAVVLELEQIAVLGTLEGQGIGSQLIHDSLNAIKSFLQDNDANLKSILISTRTNNKAKKLYEKTLNAKEIVKINNLYSSEEVLMLADDV